MSAPRFEAQALLDEARRASGGLEDFGPGPYRAALEVLCAALESQGKLSDIGRHALYQKLLGQLVNRLRLERDFARHPEIAREPVAPPLVIVGLPRTGTTKLHRMLSRNPQLWWMAFWESQFPLPLQDEAKGESRARIAQARALVEMMTGASPKLMAIHPMAAEEADEEVMLMEHSLLSAFDAYANIPAYVDWLDAQDQTPAYEYLRRMLQHLQWQKRQRGVQAQRWLLKAPHHLLRMDVLLRVFPGVQVVQTHRDPVVSIPSIASFIDTLWRIYSEEADAHAAGRSWSERMRRGLLHTMHVREQAPQQFLDVRFEDTVRAPMDVARRVHEFAGLEFTDEVAAAMRQWLTEDERSHAAVHEYTPDQFGLSAPQLERDFAPYRERHIL